MKQQKIKRIYQGRNVVTVSDAVGRDLVEEFALRPAQLKTIYNPFDITALRAEAEADSERPDGDYLIHVGRFHPANAMTACLKPMRRAASTHRWCC